MCIIIIIICEYIHNYYVYTTCTYGHNLCVCMCIGERSRKKTCMCTFTMFTSIQDVNPVNYTGIAR